jgi:hypothetical protein
VYGGGTAIWIQGFALAREALYHLSHSASPFCVGYFGNKVLLFCLGWLKPLISASWVARITGVSHWCLATRCNVLERWGSNWAGKCGLVVEFGSRLSPAPQKKKKGRDVAQMVEYPSSMHKALGVISSITHTKRCAWHSLLQSERSTEWGRRLGVQASLGYVVRSCVKKNLKKQTNK